LRTSSSTAPSLVSTLARLEIALFSDESQQRDPCVPVVVSGGASSRQIAITDGHLGLKWQPLGGARGDGISPTIGW
jgi:hypothetical protein